MSRDIEHRTAFESHGETYTRMLAAKGGDIGAQASAWLAEQQALRDEAAASKRDAREEETLRIARDALAEAASANDIARSNRNIAIAAAVIAVASAIAQIIWQ